MWGLVPSASQFVIREIPVELYIALRWTISGLIFLIYVVARRRFTWPATQDFLKVIVLGVCGYGVASLGTLYGLKLGGVSNFALVSAFNPMTTSMIAMLVLKERPNPRFWIALPLSILGLLFLVFGKYELSSLSVTLSAAGLIVGAAILEAVTFTFSKRLKSKVGTLEYLAIAQLSAALVMWGLQASVLHQCVALGQLTEMGWGAAIFVSIVACVFCYAVLYWLLNHVDGHKLALFDGLHALSATLFGWWMFHEVLNRFMLVGGIFLLAGLWIGTSPPPRRQS